MKGWGSPTAQRWQKLLQILSRQLSPGLTLETVSLGWLVVAIPAFKHLTDVFVPHFCGDAMQGVDSLSLQKGQEL
jgi:hypothetical protein